jgi:hypothetical protein
MTAVHSSLAVYRLLADFVDTYQGERISLGDLVQATGQHGLMFLLLIFALFCAVPLPIPGIHMILSMPLFYITIQMAAGRSILWLPDRLLRVTLPRNGFVLLLKKTDQWFDWLDNFMRPRLVPLTGLVAHRLIGAIALFITCIIIIPLPLTNVVPSLAIALMAMGALGRDGLTVLLAAIGGVLWCLAWLALTVWLGWAGMQGIYGLLFTP